jgi:hypothetical protein
VRSFFAEWKKKRKGIEGLDDLKTCFEKLSKKHFVQMDVARIGSKLWAALSVTPSLPF